MTVELPEVLRVVDPTGRTYYLGSFLPGDIKQLTYVPVVNPTPLEGMDKTSVLNEEPGGYQRAGDYGRMSKIARFVENRPNCILPPVVLCARGKWSFVPSSVKSNCGKLEAAELAAIIDGQHRLGGLWQLAGKSETLEVLKKKPIAFMAIDEMTLEDERREFVDINDNQKGVKKSLLAYLERDSSFWGMAAYALAEDEESVFKGRIDIQKKHDWDLFLFKAAQESVQLLFDQALRTTKSFDPVGNEAVREAALDHLLKYWRTVSECMPEFWADMGLMPEPGKSKSTERPGTRKFEYRLLEETGFRAMSKLGAKIFTASWVQGTQSPSWEAVEVWLKKLAENDKVRLVLTKPHRDPEVLQLNPGLKSTGKAGVELIFTYLDSELLEIIQGH